MKKLLAVLLATVMTMSLLTACSSNKAAETTKETEAYVTLLFLNYK